MSVTTAQSALSPENELLSFKDKKKFFEQEIAEQASAPKKTERKFSYLQEHEVAKLKKEEEKKMGSMSQEEIMSKMQEQMGASSIEYKKLLKSLEKGNSPNVRTAKSEKRHSGKKHDGDSPPGEGRQLSPAEERMIQAEKKAAWRKARMKSLEEDAMRAQAVIAKSKELQDGASQDDPSALATVDIDIAEGEDSENCNSPTDQVEITKQQIVELELESNSNTSEPHRTSNGGL